MREKIGGALFAVGAVAWVVALVIPSTVQAGVAYGVGVVAIYAAVALGYWGEGRA